MLENNNNKMITEITDLVRKTKGKLSKEIKVLCQIVLVNNKFDK